MCSLNECSERVKFSVPWLNIWPHGGLKMGQIWSLWTLTVKALIQFFSNIGEYLEMIRFSVPWQIIWSHGGQKMGKIWGFWTLTEKVFNQLISDLASVLIGWEFWKFSIFAPLAKFLASCLSKNGSGLALIEKFFIQFISNLAGVFIEWMSQMIRFLASWPNIWPPGRLKIGKIWGLQTLTEKVFIQFISNLAGVLIEWVFSNFSICGPVVKFLAPCGQTMKITKHSSERLMYVTGSRAVVKDSAITDTDAWLTHLPWTKWLPFHRQYFQMHFREWNVLYFDWNFTEVCS